MSDRTTKNNSKPAKKKRKRWYSSFFGFLLAMWALIIVGGGIVVMVLGPISISGYGEQLDWLIASATKAIVAIVLVVVWILILSKLKNWIFRKDLRS